MSEAFSRTLRSLRSADRRWPQWLVGLTALLAAGWIGWAFLAEVTVVEVSKEASIEANPAPLRLQASVTAKVLSRQATLGARVDEGDVLFELDKSSLEHELDGYLRLQAALPEQLAAMDKEVEVLEAQLVRRARLAQAEAAELRALKRQEAARGDQAARERETLEKLSDVGAVARLDRDRARAQARQSVAAAEALEARLAKISTAEGFDRGEQEVRVSRLVRDAAALRAEGERIATVIARLQGQVRERTIRAPRAGTIVAVEELTAGAVVSPGQWLVTLVPDGELRVLAKMDSAAAAKVRVGQVARLEVDGYPWTQYNTITCEVTGVSGDVSRDGDSTIVLAITGDAGDIPLRHGHTGRVDVVVERVSPAILALRAAGLAARGNDE